MATSAPSMMKKFINDPADVVKESLAGLAAAHSFVRSGLALDKCNSKAIYLGANVRRFFH